MMTMYWIGLTILLSIAILGFDGCNHQAGNPSRPEDPLSLGAGHFESGTTGGAEDETKAIDHPE